MSLTFRVDPQKYSTGDRPSINGTILDSDIIQGSSELAFATIRAINNNDAPMIRESAVNLTVTDFTFNFEDTVDRFQFGNLWLRAFFRETTSITLDGNITDSETALTFTVVSGLIPLKGWLKIDDEIMTFTRDTATTITAGRAAFRTLAAAHTTGVAVAFSKSAITALNNYEIEFESDDDRLFRFHNLRFRGE